MEIVALVFIVLLILITLALTVYNYIIHKRIKEYSSINQRVTSLHVLQDFMNTLGDNLTINEKLENINDILINKYSIKYSTIVVFDGAEYVVKASNVDQKHWDTLRNLQSDPVFKESIQTATPKYVTVDNENEKLPYQKTELGRAKCAMFFPLYVDNIYIGYWIIEGSKPHEFDNLDTTILEVVRNNIVTILKTVDNQATLENIVRDDKFSGLKSETYLYGEGKKIIDQFTTSAVCIFKVVNLPKINEEVDRDTGNRTITEISKFVKNNLAKEYIFVRYMGPKFAIIFSGVDVKGAENFMQDLKAKIEKLPINYEYYETEDENEEPKIDQVYPKIRVAISTYYKGTSLDGTLKKLEQYIDSADDATISSL